MVKWGFEPRNVWFHSPFCHHYGMLASVKPVFFSRELLSKQLLYGPHWPDVWALDKSTANACPLGFSLDKYRQQRLALTCGWSLTCAFYPRVWKGRGCVAMRHLDSSTERNGAARQVYNLTPSGSWAFEAPLPWKRRKTEKAKEKISRGRAESMAPFSEVQSSVLIVREWPRNLCFLEWASLRIKIKTPPSDWDGISRPSSLSSSYCGRIEGQARTARGPAT